MRTIQLPLLPLAGALLFPPTLCADDYHYNNMLIGDRATGLGGAYTAVSDDPSGLWYNPAGIVYAGGRNFSASVNAFHRTRAKYRNVLGSDWERESYTLLPNFFGVIQPLSGWFLGFSYAVPDSIFENQDQSMDRIPGTSVNQYIINVNNEDNTYKLGPSAAVALNERLSVGFTLYGHYRSSELIVNQVIGFETGEYEWTNSYLQSSESGFEPVLGVMWNPVTNLAIGLSVRRTFVLSSRTDLQVSCATNLGTESLPSSACPRQDGTPETAIHHLDLKRNHPLSVTLGTAYFPSNRLLLSADLSYFTRADGEVRANLDNPFRTKLETWNASAGIEYYLSDTWAIRSGVYTNRANTPAVDPEGVNQPDHVNLVGLAASLSRFTRSSSLTFGFARSEGSGKAQAIQGVPQIQDLEADSLTLFLSTAYSY